MRNVYLITGASSDIGMAFLSSAAAKHPDALFYAHYRTMSDRLAGLKEELGERMQMIQADLSDENGIQTVIDSVIQVPTHILHLPAGKLELARLKQVSPRSIERQMQVQVYSLVGLYKHFLPLMAKQKHGYCVAVVSSVVEGLPPKFMTEYVIVKSALLGLVKSMAAEYVSKGVFINAVSPNMVQTKFLEHIDSRMLENLADASPLERHLRPEEVIGAIEFLFSGETPAWGKNLII